ncbi:hypothetical protein NQ314_007180 [Rhamnusium bicolor]|uniref:Uncharacterized protein n=1 Tax=Rhamnusium bicolor TaxID=1586634 RepID=A0AAV8YPY3_9CUCU|nr:hypothetical protein NQ314_007180 [Rhamnusium bicolor]
MDWLCHRKNFRNPQQAHQNRKLHHNLKDYHNENRENSRIGGLNRGIDYGCILEILDNDYARLMVQYNDREYLQLAGPRIQYGLDGDHD